VGGSLVSNSATPLPTFIPGDLVLGRNGVLTDFLTVAGTFSVPAGIVAIGTLAVRAQTAVIAGQLDGTNWGYGDGTGPGCSSAAGCSHGGLGAGATPDTLYDSSTAPFEWGSGQNTEAPGGGRVYIAADGPLIVSGSIEVSASAANGSGGSIMLVGSSIEGGGTLLARGGATGGGGGRIALFGTLTAFSTIDVSGATALGPSGKGTMVQAEHVVLDSPLPDAQGDGTLAWTFADLPAGGGYRVFVNDDPHLGDAPFNARLLDPGEPIRSASTDAGTYTFSDLTPLHRYFWQVLALSVDGGVIAGSELGYFCTGQPCTTGINWPDGGADAGAPISMDGPPSFISQAPPFARCGVGYAYQPMVAGQRPLTFSISAGPNVGLPPNATVDASSGAVSFTPDSEEDGVYSVVLSAHNDLGQAQQPFEVYVFCSPPRKLNACSCGFGAPAALLCLLWMRARRSRRS
jgi:hypothetical protein